jgi:hypothetical protein
MLIVDCSDVLWTLLIVRNDMCFNGNNVFNISNVVLLCCFSMDFWALIPKKDNIREAGGRKQPNQKITKYVFNSSFGWK